MKPERSLEEAPTLAGWRPQPLPLRSPTLHETVALWSCSLDHPPGAAKALAGTLSAAERDRAARFGTSTLRERYIIGRATLRQLLSEALDIAPSEIPIVRGPRGRPRLDGIRALDFNVSHSGDIAVYALGIALPSAMRVGIDVERRSRRADVARLGRKVLALQERERLNRLPEDDARVHFLMTWTCKEAMSKATGDGLRAPFASIEVEPTDPPRLIDGPPPYTPDRWSLHRAEVAEGYIVTVALHQT